MGKRMVYKIIFSYYPIAIMLMVPLVVAFYVLFLFKRRFIDKKRLKFQHSESKFLTLRSSQWLLLILVIANAAFFGMARYTEFDFPQGSDTSVYIYFLEKIDRTVCSEELVEAITVPKLLFVYLLYFTWKISLVDIYTYMKIIPTVILVLYSLSWYYLVFKLSSESSFAFLAAFLAPTWFSTIRLSYDLHSNLFALSMLNILLALIFSELTSRNGKSSKKIIPQILLLYVFAAFSHQYTATLGLALIMLHMASQKLFSDEDLTLAEVFTVLVMILVLGTSYGLTLIYSPHVYHNYMITQKLYFGYMHSLSSRDTSIMVLLSLTALVVLTSQVSRHNVGLMEHFILLYLGLIAGLTFITSGLIWRIWLLYPVPLLAAYALNKMYVTVGWLGDVEISHKLTSSLLRYFKVFAVVFVLALQIFSSASNAYSPEIAYVPQQEVVNNYLAIRTKYGFSNQSIRVYINVEQPYYHRWALAILGDVIIAGGNLAEEDKKLSLHEWKAKHFTTTYTDSLYTLLKESQDKTIIIPYTLYNNLTDEEKALARLIGMHEKECDAILISPIDLDQVILSKAFLVVNSSDSWKIEWPKDYQKYNITVDYDNYTKFSAIMPEDVYVVFSLEKAVNITDTGNVTVAIKYEITNSSLSNIYLERVYKKEKKGYQLDSTKEMSIVDMETPITGFNLVFKPEPGFEGVRITIKVEYVAIVSPSSSIKL